MYRRISVCIVKHQPPAAANISSRSFSEGAPLFPIMYVCMYVCMYVVI